MTAWKLITASAGDEMVQAVLFAGPDADHLTQVGRLELTRAEYADLAARLGAEAGESDSNDFAAPSTPPEWPPYVLDPSFRPEA